MKKYILFILLSSQLLACQSEPTTPIPKQKLIPLLSDIHLAEAAVMGELKKKKDTILRKYYLQIFDIHQVQEAEFDSSMAVLKLHPDLFHSVYQEVMEEIDRQKAEIK